jgi:hypothetical protein
MSMILSAENADGLAVIQPGKDVAPGCEVK